MEMLRMGGLERATGGGEVGDVGLERKSCRRWSFGRRFKSRLL
jgi:hypothetical protein